MNIPPFLATFFAAYIEAALFSTCDDNQQPLDKKYTQANIDPETLATMRADCLAFYCENNLIDLPESLQRDAGKDFWLTRNGHGAGFWDGDWPEPLASNLTAAAHLYGTFELYVGDDGQIYGTPNMCPDERREDYAVTA